MYYRDLSNYSYHLTKPIPKAKNVGWLDAAHEFPKGEVSPALLEKLRALIIGTKDSDVIVNKVRCIHPCNFCGLENVVLSGVHRKVHLGMSQIWIPDIGPNRFFAAPSMILHYIEKHQYRPPSTFLDAIEHFEINGPFNGQTAYTDSVAQLGRVYF